MNFRLNIQINNFITFLWAWIGLHLDLGTGNQHPQHDPAASRRIWHHRPVYLPDVPCLRRLVIEAGGASQDAVVGRGRHADNELL